MNMHGQLLTVLVPEARYPINPTLSDHRERSVGLHINPILRVNDTLQALYSQRFVKITLPIEQQLLHLDVARKVTVKNGELKYSNC